jgi:hypothetical protein
MQMRYFTFALMLILANCKPCYKPFASLDNHTSVNLICHNELKPLTSHWQYCEVEKLYRIDGITETEFLKALSVSCLNAMNIATIESILGASSEKTIDTLIYYLNDGCVSSTKDGCSAIVVQFHDSKVFDLRIQRLDSLK